LAKNLKETLVKERHQTNAHFKLNFTGIDSYLRENVYLDRKSTHFLRIYATVYKYWWESLAL